MHDSRDIRKIIWPDDRDSTFLQWLAEDVTLLRDAGFSVEETIKMICSLSYVKFWCANPSWLYPIAGLPTGYRWRDGQKFVQRARAQKADAHTYIFLPIGEDLYIKGICAVGTHITDFKGAKIKGFRTLAYHEVVTKFSILGERTNPFFENSLLKFWQSQGLGLFNKPSYLRPLCKQQQSSDKVKSKQPQFK